MHRGAGALLCAVFVASSLAGCAGDIESVSQHAAAVSTGSDGGVSATPATSADPPDPYGLSNKTTAELRAQLHQVMAGARYGDLPADKRARVDSLLRFTARRLGYPSFEQRMAYDPTDEQGVSASSLSPARPPEGGGQ